MNRLRAFVLLLVRTLRLLPWWHVGLGVVAAFALAAARRNPYPDDVVFGLRVGAVALAASVAFVFDDPAVNVMDGKPVPLSRQRLSRLAVMLPVVTFGWWLLMRWMEAGMEPAAAPFPRWAVTLEFAGLVGIVWAVATLAMVTGRDGGGTTAALSLLAVVVALVLLPERWSVFPSPAVAPGPGEVASIGWEAWVEGHRRWAVIAVTAWAGVALGILGSSRRQTAIPRVPVPGRAR